jgi:hypothetical protein
MLGLVTGLSWTPFLDTGFYLDPDLEFFLGGLGGTANLFKLTLPAD